MTRGAAIGASTPDKRYEVLGDSRTGTQMKPALLVVDIQNAWLGNSPELKASIEKRLHTINGAIDWFRKKKHPILVIQHEDRKEGVTSGTEAFETSSSVQIEDGDVRITKQYPNSFNKTGLESILTMRGCDTVLIVGLSASGCALATCLGAEDHDLKSFLVKDGVASHDENHVRFAEEICETIGLDEFDSRLD
jgi:nicotinamidase-related amidase